MKKPDHLWPCFERETGTSWPNDSYRPDKQVLSNALSHKIWACYLPFGEDVHVVTHNVRCCMKVLAEDEISKPRKRTDGGVVKSHEAGSEAG